MLFAKKDNIYLNYRSIVAIWCQHVSIIIHNVVLLRVLWLYNTPDIKRSSSGAAWLIVCFLTI